MEDALEALDGLCTICEAIPAIHDAKGLPWCSEHAYRGEFVNWGAKHGWLALELAPYAVAQGEWFWVNAAMLGDDEYVWQMLLAIEEIVYQESEHVA